MQDFLTSFAAGTQAQTPKQLQELGQQAAAKHLRDGIPLETALHSVLRENGGLNQDQVTRVTEAANISVFQSRFSSEPEKNFEFDTAQPTNIWNQLTADRLEKSIPPAPRGADDAAYAYQTQPDDYRTQLAPSLEEVFAPRNGGGDLPMNDPISEEVTGLVESADALSNETSKAASAQMRVDNEAHDFVNKAAALFLGGTTLGDIATICESAADGNVKIAADMGCMVLDHLRDRGVADLDAMQTSLNQVQHHMPNPDHDLYKAASRLATLIDTRDQQMVKLSAAQLRRAAFLKGLGE